jgi:fused signal recognition particle receptor
MFKFLKDSFQKVANALSKTRSALNLKIRALFGKPWNEATFEEMEKILYEADLGTACAEEFVAHIRSFLKKQPDASPDQILEALQAHARALLSKPPRVQPSPPATEGPTVLLVVGVNGSGKTTSIAKLAHRFQKEGKRVLLAAGDTFRAAAIDQLDAWAQRLRLDIVKSRPGGDPSAVAFDALTAAKARGADIVIVDTAGRLQNKKELMQELEKIRRVMVKVIPSAPHETLLVLDATTGQNALDQAAAFHQSTPLTGLILAKVDGSAKGGIILAIYQQLGVPVQWIGVGEKMDDLQPFEPDAYAAALFDQGAGS